MAFYVRRALETLLTRDVPLPTGPQLYGYPTHDPFALSHAGVHVFVPARHCCTRWRPTSGPARACSPGVDTGRDGGERDAGAVRVLWEAVGSLGDGFTALLRQVSPRALTACPGCGRAGVISGWPCGRCGGLGVTAED